MCGVQRFHVLAEAACQGRQPVLRLLCSKRGGAPCSFVNIGRGMRVTQRSTGGKYSGHAVDLKILAEVP